MSPIKLYTFYQSGSAFRVRIALELKRLRYESIFIQGGRNSADLQSEAFLNLNPQGTIPALIHEDRVLTQSIPIIEYLEDVFPTPALLPPTAMERHRVRAISQLIVSDVHPLITARVIEYLDVNLCLGADIRENWLQHWIEKGLSALERLLFRDPNTGIFCHGDSPTLADICLVPQIYTAVRFGCDLSDFPTIERIHAQCMTHPSFQAAAPENQPDTPQSLK